MITGVIYARVSSIGDRQSTERQVKDLSEYAKYKGIEVCKVFEEHISGAKKNDGRTVLCEAMEYCKANRIGILLVSELSRLVGLQIFCSGNRPCVRVPHPIAINQKAVNEIHNG